MSAYRLKFIDVEVVLLVFMGKGQAEPNGGVVQNFSQTVLFPSRIENVLENVNSAREVNCYWLLKIVSN